MQRRQFMKMLAAGGTVSALGACVPLGTPLGTLGAREVAQADFDVIVVGAGISGLNAAMALEMQNRKVLVLEASQRVGGRMYTMEAGGLQFDVGATDVGGNYWMTRAMSQRLGVTVRDPAPGDTSRAFGTILAHANQGAGSDTGFLCIAYFNPSQAGITGSYQISFDGPAAGGRPAALITTVAMITLSGSPAGGALLSRPRLSNQTRPRCASNTAPPTR